MTYRTQLAKFSLLLLMICVVLGGLLAFKSNYYRTSKGAVIYCSSNTSHCCTSTLTNYTIPPNPLGTLVYCTLSYCAPCTERTFITLME
jgi:hypothetical protein